MPSDLQNTVCIIIPAYKPLQQIIGVVQSLHSVAAVAQVIVVDDGSSHETQSIFRAVENLGNVTLLRHAVNLGKGQALKTAFNHVLLNYPTASGVVTADADGQHLAEDILNVAQQLIEHVRNQEPAQLILGTRAFDKDVPFRSKFGNVVTSNIFAALLGKRINDTQTGLRGIPLALLPALLSLRSNRYEFEMEMLLTAVHRGIRISEVAIKTVYLNNNVHSHFSPLRDSVSIYFILFRHLGNAVVTAVIDYVVFAISLFFSSSLLTAMITGRVVAGCFNFTIGRKLVFKSRGAIFRELVSYTTLVLLLMAVSYLSINALVTSTGLSKYVAKLLVESAIFFVSFAAQRIFVFSPQGAANTRTDWESYYAERGSNRTPTRRITEQFLLSTLGRQPLNGISSIIEFGGADSCFYDGFRKRFPHVHYKIVDSSPRGVEKFLTARAGENCSAICADIFSSPSIQKGDVAFSVGLIEHFNECQTARCIEAHFDAVSTGGLVLLSFPTPTPLYRLVRFLSEAFGFWRFHDERALLPGEVKAVCDRHGTLLDSRLNWYIGLTQHILLYRKDRE